jgi:RNA polymerase sigma-54 factor
VSQAEKAMRLLQGCEPEGIGARFLGEAILLQLPDSEKNDSPLARILRQCYDAFLNKDFEEIFHATGMDEEEVLDAFDRVRDLKYKLVDCEDEHDAISRPSMPEVYVEAIVGGFEIFLDGSSYPDIVMNTDEVDRLRSRLKRGCDASKKLTVMKDRSGRLLKAVTFRRDLLLNIMKYVVARQHRFFSTGSVADMRPLTMTNVAAVVGCSGSTISRALKDHHVGTIHGTFPVSLLFTTAISLVSGEMVSVQQVKEWLRLLIAQRDGESALSDRILSVEMRRKHNVCMAVRTVNKYRKRISIIPSQKV